MFPVLSWRHSVVLPEYLGIVKLVAEADLFRYVLERYPIYQQRYGLLNAKRLPDSTIQIESV